MHPDAPRTFPPFPTRFPVGPALALSRRSRSTTAPACDDAETDVTEVARMLRQMEQALGERERAVAEAQARLAERTRDLDEMEALLRAREALLASARFSDSSRHGVVTLREAEALHQLKDELDRQEATLRETRAALREREKFLENSEARLFEKVQAHQEKETELEQREENLAARPAASAHRAATPLDEFRE